MGTRKHRHGGDEEEWEVRDSRPRHDQDAQEASDQGGQEGDVWQDSLGEGEAGQDGREGVPRKGAQERILRSSSFAPEAQRAGRTGAWSRTACSAEPAGCTSSLL